MRKGTKKQSSKKPVESITPQDALLLAVCCYAELTSDIEPPGKMTKADLICLVIKHMDVVRNAGITSLERWIEGEDKAKENGFLNAKIGTPKRIASSLMTEIAFTIEKTFANASFSLPKLVNAMKERGLPCLPNETRAMAEELTDVVKAINTDDDGTWIYRKANQLRVHRSTLKRHVDAGLSWIRKHGTGYEILESHLAEYE